MLVMAISYQTVAFRSRAGETRRKTVIERENEVEKKERKTVIKEEERI